MPLTAVQQKTLELLRLHRTDRSWLAGSIVLHDILSRDVGDIDIHHHSAEEMSAVMERDTDLLVNHDFRWVKTEYSEYEIERFFSNGTALVSINWVWDTPETLFPLCHDVSFGVHIDVRDAIYQKLLMTFDAASDKHFSDLADCSNAELLSRQLIETAAQAQQIRQPEAFCHDIEIGLRHTGRLSNKSETLGHGSGSFAR